MRRRTRTRRLSIAAIASLLAFVVVAAAGVRSFWNCDAWQTVVNGEGYAFYVMLGTAGFGCRSGEAIPSQRAGYFHADLNPDRYAVRFGIREFQFHASREEAEIDVRIPLWPLLLLLLIAPVRWLIARPANAPAFPVITDAKQACRERPDYHVSMRRLVAAILSAVLFTASLLLWVGSLHKPCVLTYHGIGGTVIYSFDDAICLTSARNFSASSVGRFGYLTQSTNTVVLVRLWGVALIAAIAFAFALWYQRNPKRGHCTHCGYNLTGNTSGICPECGTRIPTEPQ